MLVIECEEAADHSHLPPGLYKLNTRITDKLSICELKGETSNYSGIIEVDAHTEIRKYAYKLFEGKTAKDGYTEYQLPNTAFKSNWEIITCSEVVKYRAFNLLHKIYKLRGQQSLLATFSINNAMLLHGPPGTGKSTLGRAIAQKLAIRTGCPLRLKEINCGHLFSKFYGESPQILGRLFRDAGQNDVYIIDEVESLMARRDSLLSKNEPNDSIRLVNMFLGILDERKSMFIFTSNFPDALDQAFLDRCDLGIEMPLSPRHAVYGLVVASMLRMMDSGLLQYHIFPDFDEAAQTGRMGDDECSQAVLKISSMVGGTSGRKIKKLLFEAVELKDKSVNRFLARLVHNLESNKFTGS